MSWYEKRRPAANAPHAPSILGERLTRVLAPRVRAAGDWLRSGVRRPSRTPRQTFAALVAAAVVIGISRFTWYPRVREAIRSRYGAQASYDFGDLFLLFMFLVVLTPAFLSSRGSLPRWKVLVGWAVVLGFLLVLAARQVPALASAVW